MAVKGRGAALEIDGAEVIAQEEDRAAQSLCLGEGEAGEAGAAGKSTFAHSTDLTGEGDIGQSGAVCESAAADVRSGGNVDGLQGGAAVKHVAAQCFQTFLQGHICQRSTAAEQVVAAGKIAHGDLLDAGAAGEHAHVIIAFQRDAVGDGDLRQAGAAVESRSFHTLHIA